MKNILQINKLAILLIASLYISGCSYIAPFVDVSDASELASEGRYEEAIPLFEKAISGFSKVSAYESFEYDARCEYALTLNEYSKLGVSDHIPTARKNFSMVLAYLKKGNSIIRCTKGVVISSRANTLQQEATYAENDEDYYELLKRAYSSYQDAIEPLIQEKEWLSLAYTYFNLAETSEMYGDIPEAIKWIEKAISVNKKHDFKNNLVEDANYLEQLRTKNEDQLNKFKNENTSEAGTDAQQDARPF